MDLEYFMDKALEQARLALDRDEVPVGAVVVLDGKIIGAGYNTVESSNHSMEHAEMNAIRQAQDYLGDWRLTGAYLFTSLEPCIMCAGAIINSRIDTLVYAADDKNRGFAGSVLNIVDDSIFNHRVNVISGIKQEEASKILKDFFKDKR